MRPEELVRRADEDVDVPGGHVDRTVRRVVHGVCPCESTGVVGERRRFAARRAPFRPSSRRPGMRPPASGPRAAGQDRRSRPRAPPSLRRRVRRCRDREPARATERCSRRGRGSSRRLRRPARSVRAKARVSRKLSAVMLGPNATSPGEQPRKAAARSRASRRARPCAGSSRRGRRCWRWIPAGIRKSRRSPRPGTACRPGPSRKARRSVQRGKAPAHRADVESRRAHTSPFPLTIQW